MKKLFLLFSAGFLFINPAPSALAEEADSAVLRKAQGDEKQPEFSKIINAPAGVERKPRAKVISKAEGKELQPKVSAVIGPEGVNNLKNRKLSSSPVLTSDYLKEIKETDPDNLVTVKETAEKTEE